jgi:hypothetical protein
VVKSGSPTVNGTVNPTEDRSVDSSLDTCCGDNNVDSPQEECDSGGGLYCGPCLPNCTLAPDTPTHCEGDDNPCTTDVCDEVDGCSMVPTVCPDDGIACTVDCNPEVEGGCTHDLSDALCDDGDGCTDDVCDPEDGGSDQETGCIYPTKADDAPCADADPCTTGTTCQSGVCTDGGEACCNDLNPCTVDSCVPMAGCAHVEISSPTAECPSSCADQFGQPKPLFSACTDGKPNTVDFCPGTSTVCAGFPRCNDGSPYTIDQYDTSVPGTCGHLFNLLGTFQYPGQEATDCSDKADSYPCYSTTEQNVCGIGTCQSHVCVVQQCTDDLDPSNGEEVCSFSDEVFYDRGCMRTNVPTNCQ